MMCFRAIPFIIAAFSLMMGVPSSAKPILKLAADHFPAGHESPEGVACDLARAFINHDPKLFRDSCIPSSMYRNSIIGKRYEKFLSTMVADMHAEAKRKTPSPGGPKQIGIVFTVRHLTMDGPVSYGYAGFGLYDVAFVDVGVYLYDGTRVTNRTLVVKNAKGKWYVHPMPSVDRLLSGNLNDETNSTVTISDTYDLVPSK